MQNIKLSQTIFGLFFLLLAYLLWLMVKPMLGSFIFGGIVAGSFYPLYELLLRKSKWKKEICALIMCLFIGLLLFLPLTILIFQLSKQTVSLYNDLTSGLTDETIREFFFGNGRFARLMQKIFTFLHIDYRPDLLKEQLFPYLQNFSSFLIRTINGKVGQLLTFFWDFLLMQLFIFAFFSEGGRLKRFIFELSPLPEEQEQLILNKFNQMNYVSLVCNGLGGIIQGTLAGLGFWMAGINSTILWTAIMIVLAFIPLVGISIVYFPACFYLWIKGQHGVAIILFTYCTLVAIITENWFKPKFIGDRIRIHSLIIFFSIIGGMGVFNIAGIFYGPLIASIFLTLVELYHGHYSQSASN